MRTPKLSKAVLLSVGILITATQVSASSSLSDANEALRLGNVKEAIRLLEPPSNSGDAEAQFQLAEIYFSGFGVVQDLQKAIELFSLSAEGGNPKAQNALGRLIASGKLANDEEQDALYWLMLAAKSGDSKFQFDLASFYETQGNGASDLVSAVDWYQKSYDQGNPEAAAHLGVLLLSGKGVAKDLTKAHKLLSFAADKGVAKAQNNLGLMYVRGEGVKRDYATAAKWFKLAVGKKLPTAYRNLGVLYANGFGVELNEELANELYRKAGLGDKNSLTSISAKSTYYVDPRISSAKPSEEEIVILEVQALAGDPVSMYMLASQLVNNPTENTDYVKAAKWFRKSAELGIPSSMANMGVLHLRGLGVPQDYVFAYMWITKAVANGVPEARTLRDEMAQLLSAEQVAEALSLAQETTR